VLSTACGYLAHTLYALERYEEVDEFIRQARDLALPGDHEVQALWRSLHAKMLARRGHHGAADPLAREAVNLLAAADAPLWLYRALLDLSDVERQSGRIDAARATLEEARRIADTKRSSALVDEVNSRLIALNA
jgi:tetratricopeptide (TPR) repeat protein